MTKKVIFRERRKPLKIHHPFTMPLKGTMKEMSDVELQDIIAGEYPLLGMAFFFFFCHFFNTLYALNTLPTSPTTDSRSTRQSKAAAKAILGKRSPVSVPKKSVLKKARAKALTSVRIRRTKEEIERDNKIRDEEKKAKDKHKAASAASALAAKAEEKDKNRLWSATIYRGLDLSLQAHIPEGSYRDKDWELVAGDMNDLGRKLHEEDGEILREFDAKMCYDQFCRVSN